MKRQTLRIGIVALFITASIFSYMYLNCCASINETLSGSEEKREMVEKPSMQDQTVKLPDLHMVSKIVEVVTQILPAS